MSDKKDVGFLTASIVGIVAWIFYAEQVPQGYGLFYLLFLALLLIPFFYILSLKRQAYQWSGEKMIYLFLLTLVGIFTFSHSILGVDPKDAMLGLFRSSEEFLR